MALISVSSILALRRDRRLLHLPPWLSLICVIVGVVWLLLLPLDNYSRRTYISENALLPGQVHTYFSGSEYDIYDAYRREVEKLRLRPARVVTSKLLEIFESSGLKTGTQKYQYNVGGWRTEDENVYAILRAPRGDATEAIVLIASARNMENDWNGAGMTLVLTLSRYFKRWSLWSKDIIFLITPDSKAGPQAWVDAYHDRHDPAYISSLPVKSGALQGAIAVDFPLNHNFRTMHVSYDGINGQLSNLDLFNTAINVANGQHGMQVALQHVIGETNGYLQRLRIMLKGMVTQGLGHATGPHSVFPPYHVDAITLRSVEEGPEDECAFGRVVESMFRSLNNLMEHFHQSFFFYLLMDTRRFVSIGTYLPSAMLVAASFTITAIALWVASGRPEKDVKLQAEQKKAGEVEVVTHKGHEAVIPKQELQIVERHLLVPAIAILALHFLGAVPLYLFNSASRKYYEPLFLGFTVFNAVLPVALASTFRGYAKPTYQQVLLLKCFSLLLLGMFLATLATVNFALSLFVGLLTAPLTFVGASGVPKSSQIQDPSRLKVISLLSKLGMQLISPPAVFGLGCLVLAVRPSQILYQAAFGWHVWGLWTQVIVWCIWWPAWLAGSVGLYL